MLDGSRWGVRTRVIAGFTAGALITSTILAGATYVAASHALLQDQQRAAVHQTVIDARALRADLAGGSFVPSQVLESLNPGKHVHVLLARGSQWYSTSVTFDHHDLPTSVVATVRSGIPASQRTVLGGVPEFAVGIPVFAHRIDFFEVFSLAGLLHTLNVIAAVLAVLAVITTVIGGMIGWWGSRRLLRPLAVVAAAAASVSAGDLTTRLPVSDPDLAPMNSSFNGMVDTLRSRIERDAYFASNVSHELRSPLTTLQTSVDVLGRFDEVLPPVGRRALGLVTTEMARFSLMVQDLLEISRLDAGAALVDLEEVDLGAVVEQIGLL